MKKFAVVLLLLLIIAAGATPVAADQPVLFWEGDIDDTWPFIDCRPFGSGYEFTIWVHQLGHGKQTGYFKGGELVRVLEQGEGVGYLYNENHPSFTIPNTYSAQGHVEVLSDPDGNYRYRATGLFYSMQLPGKGTVIHISGQEVGVVTNWQFSTPEILKQVGNDTLDKPLLCKIFAN